MVSFPLFSLVLSLGTTFKLRLFIFCGRINLLFLNKNFEKIIRKELERSDGEDVIDVPNSLTARRMNLNECAYSPSPKVIEAIKN